MGCCNGKLDKLEGEFHKNEPAIQTVFQQNSNKRTKRTSAETLSKQNLKARSNRKDQLNVMYEFKAVISKGAYSEVNRVEKRDTKQPYAVKIIDTRKSRPPTLESELKILRRLNHPNIIPLIEVIETPKKTCFVMDLATGGSLLDRLQTYGAFSEPDAVKMLKMLLSALCYLHNLGITHRDLKPDNLLYYHPGADSKIMLIDFGFSSAPRSNGDPYMQTLCGTPQYLAPEVISRQSYTNAADMWAVAIICYETLSGSFPFYSDKLPVMYKQILKGSYDMNGSVWDGISDCAKQFIHALLQRLPENRLTATEAANHEWIQGTSSVNPEKVKPKLNSRYSNRSSSSGLSSVSRKSSRSLRSHQCHVEAAHFKSLKTDPELAHIL